MIRTRWTWILFIACAVAILVALAGISASLIAMERREAEARADARMQESIRLALWRMDSAIAPILTREASRPHFHYVPFYSPDRSYTRMLRPLEEGEIIVPSPLLGRGPQFCRLHVQIAPDGRISSPRVPSGNLLDLAETDYVTPEEIERGTALLGRFQMMASSCSLASLLPKLAAEQNREPIPEPLVLDVPSQQQSDIVSPKAQKARSAVENRRRQDIARNAIEQAQYGNSPWTQAITPEKELIRISELTPVWIRSDGLPGSETTDELLLVRTVDIDDARITQGVWIDWPELRDWLQSQIGDLLTDAAITPVIRGSETTDNARMLASIPASLVLATRSPVHLGALTPTRATLIVAWIAAIASIIATGFGLRVLRADQRRRARFVSAVTHELRTPLTTFCLYSQMLADGMIRDAPKREQYLNTLKEESVRLSRIVENVLSYARLSDFRTTTPQGVTDLGETIDRLVPRLAGRLGESGMKLDGNWTDAVGVRVLADDATLERILTNLIDNAGKYASEASDKRVHLEVSVAPRTVRIRVADHGGGLSDSSRHRVFQAFERGPADQTLGKPGLGLGLALARSLARELGGDLCVAHEEGRGAVLEFTVERAGSAEPPNALSNSE